MKYLYLPTLFTILLVALTSNTSIAQLVPKNQEYVLIFPKSGTGFPATVLRVENDSLVVYAEEVHSIAKKDISKLILHPKQESGRGFVIGSFLGVYVMNYLLGIATGQPGGFLAANLYGSRYTNTSSYSSSNSFGVVGIGLLGIAVGGGLGYLLDANHDGISEMIFVFGGSQTIQDEQWAKATEAMQNKVRRSKLHFDIAGTLVFPNIANTYHDELGSGSNAYYSGSYPYSNYVESSSDFNWLRSMGLRYSVSDDAQIGFAYALLGEPAYLYGSNIYPLSYPAVTNRNATLRVDGKGFYLTGSYSKFLGKNDELEAVFTGGVGLASMLFDISTSTRFDTIAGYGTTISDAYSLHKPFFSAMASVGISYYLYDSFSFGLKAEYFYAGSASAPALSGGSITAHSLHFGNADIGFNVGLHF